VSEIREVVLHCAMCSRVIGGVTGLDEAQNMAAHLAEHHDLSLDMWVVLSMRERWEAEGWRW
jgi:hypothetical protein